MLHTVFQAPTVTLRCISPIALGDELLQGALSRKVRIAAHRYAQPAPVTPAGPGVLNAHAGFTAHETMRCRPGRVLLVVEHARDGRYGRTGHDLADERHASPQFIRLVAPDVQAQVDLVKIAVKSNRDTKRLHVKKAQ